MTRTSSPAVSGTSYRDEEEHLTRTLSVIQSNIDSYGAEVTRMKNEIDDMLEHFHDDNPELINTLENTLTMHENLKRALEKNEKAQNKPYFGRIVFRDEKQNREESLYIGKGGISLDRTTQIVTDWRAPVANAYYENGLGKCSYLSPDHTPIHIDLKLKRTYEIERGTLLGYYDTEVVSNDDLLTKYLAKNKQAVLSEIVATIQKEQNEIIRKSPYHNCLVQGVAGSGKTTVAMHRISYILYNYADRFRPEDFYIVGSNRILLNYITGVLPDLDVYGVRQMTMEQLFVRLLYEDWDEKKFRIRPHDPSAGNVHRGSLDWFHRLENYCRRLEWDTIPRESVYLDPRQFVEGIRNGKAGIFDDTKERPSEPGELVLLMDPAAIERYIQKNPTVSMQSKIDMLNERLYNKVKDEFSGKGTRYTEPEKRAILRAHMGKFGPRTFKKNIFAIYTDFLRQQQNAGFDVTVPDSEFDVYDLAALAYIYKRIKETEVISEAHHVVIDEAQDFGMMAYCVLKFCIKDCTYTIMGDVSQNIRFGCGLNDWEELKELMLTDPRDSFSLLVKSYRNTVEISQFATHILKHGNFFVYPAEPIIRHGLPVHQEETSPGQLCQKAAEQCRTWQEKGLNTIGVICRNLALSKTVAKELGKYIPVMESDPEKAEFGNGVMVLPVEYSKGLEFDAVLIPDPTKENYPTDDGHAKLLYVAATRALHELTILSTGSLSGLITDPVKPVKTPQPKSQPPKDRKPSPASAAPSDAPGLSCNGSPVSGQRPDRPKVPEARPVSSPVNNPQTVPAQKLSNSRTATGALASEFAFGDIPSTEMLHPPGHPRSDLSIRWVNKQQDGLYLQSRYGLLRLSPIGSDIIRITFSKGNQIMDRIHPCIKTTGIHRSWTYKDSSKCVDFFTEELCLSVDKASGAIRYMTRDKKVLLSEQAKEARQLEISPKGPMRTWLYLELTKSENLCALDGTGKSCSKLRGSAGFLAPKAKMTRLPLLLSDKGYGILPAADGISFFCDQSSCCSYLYAENSLQMDYYFITGKNTGNILSAYAYLCGNI